MIKKAYIVKKKLGNNTKKRKTENKRELLIWSTR